MRNMAAMMQKLSGLQGKMQDMQDELEATTFTANAAGGQVTASVNGKKQLVDLVIDPALMVPDEADLVADLVKVAIKNASEMAEAEQARRLKELTGGLPLPPGMSLPF
ncbi:MAG: YbaB/EbfC family nucleoid-associated protein [Candidatus Puniceispirillaceae bacterium]